MDETPYANEKAPRPMQGKHGRLDASPVDPKPLLYPTISLPQRRCESMASPKMITRKNSQFRRSHDVSQTARHLERGRASTMPYNHSSDSLLIPITNTKIYKRMLSVIYIPDVVGLTPKHRDSVLSIWPEELTESTSSGLSAEQSLMKPGGYWSSLFNLLNATLGAGSVTVPFAASRCGIIPFIIINLVLLACSVTTIEYICDAILSSGSRSFETLSATSVGLPFGVMTMLMMMLFCFGTAVGYINAVGGILERFKASIFYLYARSNGVGSKFVLTDAVDVSRFSKNWLVISIVLFCLLPLSMRSNLHDLRYTSLLGFMSICVMVCTIVANCYVSGISDSLKFEDGAMHWNRLLFGNGDLRSMVQSLGILMFSYNCHANVPSIFAELENRNTPRMKSVSSSAMSICMMVYTLAGIAGYLTNGVDTLGNILEDAPTGGSLTSVVSNMLCMVAMTFAIIFAYPMNIFPIVYSVKACSVMWHARDSDVEMDEVSTDESADDLGSVAAVVTVLLTLLVALNVTSVEAVFGIVGSVTGSTIALILPSIYALILLKKRQYQLAKIWLILIIGLSLGCLGLIQGLNAVL